jgi:exosome complex RNA-binding protein Csl4
MDKAYPGKFLGQIYSYSLGTGVYSKEDNIFSSLSGDVYIEEDFKPPRLSVRKLNNFIYRPQINDEVYCRVIKTTKNFCNCEILATKFHKLSSTIQASIRSEFVSNDYKDIDLFDCFVPGDIILAKVVATDHTNTIFLSTTSPDHGVCFARSVVSDGLMMPISFDKMLCLETGLYEPRKVAKPSI